MKKIAIVLFVLSLGVPVAAQNRDTLEREVRDDYLVPCMRAIKVEIYMASPPIPDSDVKMYTEELLEEARKLAIELRGKERRLQNGVPTARGRARCKNKVKSKPRFSSAITTQCDCSLYLHVRRMLGPSA